MTSLCHVITPIKLLTCYKLEESQFLEMYVTPCPSVWYQNVIFGVLAHGLKTRGGKRRAIGKERMWNYLNHLRRPCNNAKYLFLWFGVLGWQSSVLSGTLANLPRYIFRVALQALLRCRLLIERLEQASTFEG